jgi:hypothetical protein
MKVTFETDDPKETLRLAKSLDMALFIFELTNNAWREFEDTDFKDEVWGKINELLDYHGINVDELLE